VTLPRLDVDRLLARIAALGERGALPGGGCSRLALTDADRAGRDLVVGWMNDLGLDVVVDAMGNVFGTRPGLEDRPPVMVGSHIDTVATGGLYDGNLGVLAGLEVVAALNDAQTEKCSPIAVAVFTNEEGVRFAPDMMGSLVFAGQLAIDEAYRQVDRDGVRVDQALAQIGYLGAQACGFSVGCYLELHIEQGPVLEAEGITIGVVTGVQGISWTEFEFAGVSNHAGTTPMGMRSDAGFVAGAVSSIVQDIARSIPGQLGTVDVVEVEPCLVNVIARKSRVVVDLRNDDESLLRDAEQALNERVGTLARQEGVGCTSRSLVRTSPVQFSDRIVETVERTATACGHSARRMVSGAGHDAQMLASVCPSGMIFIPSHDALSHNVDEYSSPPEVAAGAEVLLNAVLDLAERVEPEIQRRADGPL
jgi:beta-ureidopropionase / N-carbamoyl-L-amino-acid hydrolase